MNRLPDPSPEPLEEQALFDLLGPLRDLQAPLATQIANRQSLANVLHERRQQSASRPRPWWRRSVSVPIPLAAAILPLAVVFALQQRASPSCHAVAIHARPSWQRFNPRPIVDRWNRGCISAESVR